MLNLKKFYSDDLLQIALLLSLMRVDPDSNLGLHIQIVNVGSLDLNNGSNWHYDFPTIIHRIAFVHPKNLDSLLLNYERDLFEDLNALGRYNVINNAYNNVHAYLLNVNETAGTSAAVITEAADNARNGNSPDSPMPTQTANETTPGVAELTQEDMDLIEVLWKQDVDLGFTLIDSIPSKNGATTSKKHSEDDIERFKTLEAINASNTKKNLVGEQETTKDKDPWAALPYTVDLETGEYILSTVSDSNGSSLASSFDEAESIQQKNGIKGGKNDTEHLLISETGLGLGDVNVLVGLDEDSLGLCCVDGLGLENDFSSELLGGSLLNDSVNGLLSSDSLPGLNLEEALQLVGLDEVHFEKKPDIRKKNHSSRSFGAPTPKCCFDYDDIDDDNENQKEVDTDKMIHMPQYQHSNHSHHRPFQSRVPFLRTMSAMDRQWDIPPYFSVSSTGNGTNDNFVHSGHNVYHHHHPSYANSSSTSTNHYENQRNVLLHNATLAPPVGDLNSTGNYHSASAQSNLGSAVATSMNLTNSGEPMSADSIAVYKAEPNDLVYYHNTTTDTINQNDSIFSTFLEEPLGGWSNEDLVFHVGDGVYGGAAGATGLAASLPVSGGDADSGAITHHNATTTTAGTDERLDASSDSAVSSMGSERVPSLSDGEWMETGSNSSHTQADSLYSMDYAGKYRMPYDCYTLPTSRGASQRILCQGDRGVMAPVAQKKHHMFGKRCFQDQPIQMASEAGSPVNATVHHPAETHMKYDYEAQSTAAGSPAQYSGPIEGATGPHEIKYSCSIDFTRHHQSSRSNFDHVHHNHTYHLPPESSGTLQRPITRDKKVRKSDTDEHLTRDEKRARSLNVPIPVGDIINLPMDEFNERLSKYDLSETQLSLIRDIRRRGKNKVAAQNCRKRKLDQINSLSDEVKEMRNRKMRLVSERNFMLQEVARVKEKFGLLYRHIFDSLRDSEGHPYNSMHYSLQWSAEGNVVLVPRSNQSNSIHYTRSTMESAKKDHHPTQHQDHKK